MILAASLLTGWMASGAFSSSTSSTPPTNPSANVSPELTALQQQAEQLRREVEAAKARQAAPAESPPSDSPPGPDAAPMPAGAPPAPDAATTVEASSKQEPAPPEAKPDKEDAPPPSPAEEMKENALAPSEPKPVDLAAERKALAEQIAVEAVFEDEITRTDALWELKDQELEDALSKYSPQLDVAFEKHLPQAEAEVADLDLPAIKARRQEIEVRRQAREEAALKFLAQAKEAIEQLQFTKTLQCAAKYALSRVARRKAGGQPTAPGFDEHRPLPSLRFAQQAHGGSG